MGARDLRRAVFLDRDGVIVRSNVSGGRLYAVRSLAELELLPGACEALTLLQGAGLLTIVVTNQRDVGDGLVEPATLVAMHEWLREQLPIDDIEVCTCGDGCRRYKPEPGMLVDAALRVGIDLASSFMVGDRWRDIGAGQAAGCTTVLVGNGYGEAMPVEPDVRVASISDAAAVVLASL